MKKPASIIIPAVAVLLYSTTLLFLSYAEGMILYLLWGSLFLISSIGLFFKKSWSQYIVYFMSVIAIVIWIYELGRIVLNGWPYGELIPNLWYLIYVLLIIIFYSCVSIHVFMYFKKMGRQT